MGLIFFPSQDPIHNETFPLYIHVGPTCFAIMVLASQCTSKYNLGKKLNPFLNFFFFFSLLGWRVWGEGVGFGCYIKILLVSSPQFGLNSQVLLINSKWAMWISNLEVWCLSVCREVGARGLVWYYCQIF